MKHHLFALALLTAIAPAASAKAPQAHTQAPGFYRMALGDFEITAISDGTIDLPTSLLSAPDSEAKSSLANAFVRAPVETSVTAFLVNTGDRLVLIDTGAGALFGPTLGKLLGNLRAAGYTPEQIDDVVVSHLHPDHVGGLVDHGKIAFPNATVHAAQRDLDFWLSQANLDHAPAANKPFFEGAIASMKPYAGKIKGFDGDVEVVPGVHAIATAGHSAGHTSFEVESKGKKLLVVGDLIHIAAVQLPDPGVTIAYDSDPKAAAATRMKVFTRAASDQELVAAAHMSFPGLGHLRSAARGFQWTPVTYSTELSR